MKQFVVISIICTSTLIQSSAYGQALIGDDAQENLFKLGGADASSGIVRKFDNRHSGVQGSPFYIDSWSSGSIVTTEDRQIQNVRLKFNAFEDELIILNKSGEYYVTKNQVKSFTLINDTSQVTISNL